MLRKFSIQTIEGLEIAANLYDMDEATIYKPDAFLKELKSRHDAAFEQYSEAKKAMGITTVIKEYDKIKNLLNKESALFSDYITAGRAIIELNNSTDPQ